MPHEVHFGLVVCDPDSVLDWMKLVCKKITLTNKDGKQFIYSPSIFHLITKYEENKFMFDIYDDTLTFEYHDDLDCQDAEKEVTYTNFETLIETLCDMSFFYKNNNHLWIKKPKGCPLMIVCETIERDGDCCDISEKKLGELFEWKQQLIQNGRLSPKSKLMMISSCGGETCEH